VLQLINASLTVTSEIGDNLSPNRLYDLGRLEEQVIPIRIDVYHLSAERRCFSRSLQATRMTLLLLRTN
jgi:hypothetical protein